MVISMRDKTAEGSVALFLLVALCEIHLLTTCHGYLSKNIYMTILKYSVTSKKHVYKIELKWLMHVS